MATAQDILQKLARDYALAWSSGEPEAVASFYAPDGEIVINRGDPIKGRAAVAEMAAGFYAEFPDLEVRCDLMRKGGSHAVFIWTLEGHHAETKNHVVVGGWEEWDLNDELQVVSSKGWFDADDYQRQIDGA
ncbi:nuclear transport factor 2 family protein [Tropicibacter sp. R16_0]|uniref:nuclear transport factor 2 family protein n=1 Tax=Tropicibacter sp. R16_0 TaxID=2821102 RepID=UPI001ADA4ED3|nr:nuclear transport factor 2 family protein [Tropicibacter sp. R16_0]MBO9449518.1 nuclear transport factor 2 family protein [Tropicibacter sp. R16_0]